MHPPDCSVDRHVHFVHNGVPCGATLFKLRDFQVQDVVTGDGDDLRMFEPSFGSVMLIAFRTTCDVMLLFVCSTPASTPVMSVCASRRRLRLRFLGPQVTHLR